MNQEFQSPIHERKREILIGLILSVLFPIISHVISTILQKTNIQITVVYQPVKIGNSMYPAQYIDIFLLLILLTIDRKINTLREELEYLEYKLYSLRRRSR